MHYIDLGAGWFLHNEEEPPSVHVFDSTSAKPNKFYGAAAWGHGEGPASGLELLEAMPEGDLQQVGDEEWIWVTPSGEELDYPPSWPRKIALVSGPLKPMLQHLDGRLVADEAEFIELLRSVTAGLPERKLALHSAQARLEIVKLRFPEAFD